jgi:uncharacterized glyoxalase superfamily protein PhnB
MSSPQTAEAPSKQFAFNLAPHLVCANASAAIDFYVRAFGGQELMRLAAPNGQLAHACVLINESPVMLVDENKEMHMLGPKSLGGTPVTIHLNVSDVDASIARAEKAGAKVVMPAADMFWGDRYGIVEDPFGHQWSIATHQRDLTPEEIQQAMQNAGPCGEKG